MDATIVDLATTADASRGFERSRRHTLAAAAAVVVAACAYGCAAPVGGEPTASDESALVPSIAVMSMYGQSSRLFNDYDWAYGYWKGECGADTPIMAGVSNGATQHMNFWLQTWVNVWHETVLCESTAIGVVPTGSYVLWAHDHDDMRDNFNHWDWAVGSYKAECGPTDVVVGISQDASTPDAPLAGVRCMPTTNLNPPTSCQAVGFGGRLSQTGGDWSVGYYKSQCGDGQYVKGVSQYVRWSAGGAADNWAAPILCCTPNYKLPPIIIRLP